MSIILPDTAAKPCISCGRARRSDEWFNGPRMWSENWYTCGHERTVICPECSFDKGLYPACSVCGREEVYT